MSDNAITFDIEVAGYQWEEVDEATRGYLLQRARDEEAAGKQRIQTLRRELTQDFTVMQVCVCRSVCLPSLAHAHTYAANSRTQPKNLSRAAAC